MKFSLLGLNAVVDKENSPHILFRSRFRDGRRGRLIMDEIDYVQEAVTAAQEVMLAERRKKAELEAATKPPEERECDSCGCDIPQARLKLRPLTRYCVDCQAEFENPRR